MGKKVYFVVETDEKILLKQLSRGTDGQRPLRKRPFGYTVSSVL